MVLSPSSFVKRRFLLRPNTVRVYSRGKKLVFLAEKATLPDSGHFNFENIEMPWRPRERTPGPEAKAGPRSRRASAVAAGRLMDDDSNDRLWAASALELAQFQSESALALNRLQKIQHARIQAIGGPSARNCSSTPASAGRKPSSGASVGVTQRRFWPSAGQGSPLKAVTWKKCRRTRKPRSA